MCKCLAGNVACCCFSCALSMLVSIISAFFVVFVIIALVVYFVYYHEQESDLTKIKNNIHDDVSDTFEKFKNALGNK
ncbi:hypothetical protein KR044_012538 [Drosophila immigrans]|nr:hypothetical protein KR044_012538 [Drosophila immigrans]